MYWKTEWLEKEKGCPTGLLSQVLPRSHRLPRSKLLTIAFVIKSWYRELALGIVLYRNPIEAGKNIINLPWWL
jgi:hypothetical protein